MAKSYPLEGKLVTLSKEINEDNRTLLEVMVVGLGGIYSQELVAETDLFVRCEDTKMLDLQSAIRLGANIIKEKQFEVLLDSMIKKMNDEQT